MADKEWFSISEMIQFGHTKKQLREFCLSGHSRNMVYRTSQNGKWKINKAKYEAWVMRNTV